MAPGERSRQEGPGAVVQAVHAGDDAFRSRCFGRTNERGSADPGGPAPKGGSHGCTYNRVTCCQTFILAVLIKVMSCSFSTLLIVYNKDYSRDIRGVKPGARRQ